jgi:hypothetical protein
VRTPQQPQAQPQPELRLACRGRLALPLRCYRRERDPGCDGPVVSVRPHACAADHLLEPHEKSVAPKRCQCDSRSNFLQRISEVFRLINRLTTIDLQTGMPSLTNRLGYGACDEPKAQKKIEAVKWCDLTRSVVCLIGRGQMNDVFSILRLPGEPENDCIGDDVIDEIRPCRAGKSEVGRLDRRRTTFRGPASASPWERTSRSRLMPGIPVGRLRWMSAPHLPMAWACRAGRAP